MDLGITGRTALVLGASGGLGSAVAVRLAEEGANVAAAGRSADKLADTVKRIQAAGVKALPVTWDLGDLDSVDTHVSEVENALGPVDILVNNTGGPPPTTAAGQDAATWRTSFEQMILSVIVITDRVLPGMRGRGWGRILTSTSGGALSPIPNLAISNTLRASLHTWSKTLADEVGRDGVTSNVIVPAGLRPPGRDSWTNAKPNAKEKPATT
jgi:3-oxoacyl-[acyl-carrier protein] reductase